MQTEKSTNLKIKRTVLINSDKERVKLFRNATNNFFPGITDESGKDIVKVGKIDIGLLYVDKRYQRERTNTFIRKLADDWNWRSYGFITVVPHPEDHLFSIVDGQGRYLAAIQRGIEMLPALIIMEPENLNSSIDDRLKYEAITFKEQSDHSEKVKPHEKHNAMVINGDSAACALQKVFEDYEVGLSAGGTSRAKLSCYTFIYNLMKNPKFGEDCVRWMFDQIKGSQWHDEKGAFTMYTLAPLSEIYKYYINPDTKTRMFQRDHSKEVSKFIVESWKRTTPEKFRTDAIAHYPHRTARTAAEIHLCNLVSSYLNEAVNR